MPFKQKLLVIIACTIAGSLLVAGITLYFMRYEIIFLQNSADGLKARDELDFEKAEKKLVLAVDATEHFAKTDVRRYTINYGLAQLYLATGNPKFSEIIKKLVPLASGNVQNELSVQSLVAESFYRNGDFSNSRIILQEIVEKSNVKDQTSFEIEALINLAKLDLLSANREETESHIQEVERLETKVVEPARVAIKLQILTALEAELKGRYSTAARMYEYASNIVGRIAKPTSALSLSLDDHSAYFFLRDRNALRATNISRRALKNCDKEFESFYACNVIGILSTQSEIAIGENNVSQARQSVDKEVDIAGKRLSLKHPYYGRALLHRAIVESREGKVEESNSDFAQCLQIFEKCFGGQNRFSADAILAQARVQLEHGQVENASATCKRAIAMYKAILPNDHPAALNANLLLALIYRQQQKSDIARILEVEYNEAFGAADGK